MSSAPSGLDRGSLGTTAMSFFTISASAPMTVIAGAVLAMYAVTGVTGVPLSFLVLMLALWPFTIGYTAMSRYVSHAGVFYAFLSRGLGRVAGVAGGLVALLAYNAIQICLYGLLGFNLVLFLPSAHLPWWGWALIVWAVVGVLGILHININARVLAVLLAVEIGMILLFDLGAFTHPAGGHLSLAGLAPSNLFVSGIGGVLAFGIASFVGYESAPAYSEEAKGTGPVTRSTFGALFFLGLLYAISSLALSVAVGPTAVVDAARDPASGIPFSVLSALYGSPVATLGSLLLITSIVGAMISFHNTVARYIFSLGRERILPAALGHIGSGTAAGAPIGGSIVQSVLALGVFGGFALFGLDPFTKLFTWLSAVAAIGIGVLMIGTSFAVIGYFRRNPEAAAQESGWKRIGAPALGAVTLSIVVGITVYNISSLLGTASNSPLVYILPGLVAVVALVGVIWGLILRNTKPLVYHSIGEGQLRPLEVLSPAFADLEI